MESPQYPTEPVQMMESWVRMQEIRRQRANHEFTAREKGELVVKGMGAHGGPQAILSGFGDPGNAGLGPQWDELMQDPLELNKCMEAAEVAGFSQDICSSAQCHLGQLYMGVGDWDRAGKRHVVPDFVLEMNWCRSMTKASQLYAEFLNVPFILVDIPCTESPRARQYLVDQMQEAVLQIERLTGRQFNDEEFIKGVENEWRCLTLMAKISELNKHIPAPIDMGGWGSFMRVINYYRLQATTVAMAECLYAELKDRVARGISARGWEKKRLFHEGLRPYFWPGFLELAAMYGAVYLGGELTFDNNRGAWEVSPDGSIHAAESPMERGMTLRTREDALNAMAELYLAHEPHHAFCLPSYKPTECVRRVYDWRVDGVVIHLDEYCHSTQSGMIAVMPALRQAGIPAVTYEGDHTNPRNLSIPQVRESITSFLENLGLTKLRCLDIGAQRAVSEWCTDI